MLRCAVVGLMVAVCVTGAIAAEADTEAVVSPEKAAAVQEIREALADGRKYIHYEVRGEYKPENTDRYLGLLETDGRFSDLHLEDVKPEQYGGATQLPLAGKLREAFKRIRLLAQLCLEEGEHKGDEGLKETLMRSVLYYGDIELRRADGWFRFHVSCFAIPRIVYGVYFAFFEDFAAAEKASDKVSLAGRTSAMIQALMRQTFTQPKRDDVEDPYTVDQFRKAGTYVGGNFAYRPTFEAAAVCSDARMFDVVAQVCSGALSVVSYNTRDEAFWSEGMCADGAGWGHGQQCYVWGYPSDGMGWVLALLKRFEGTPWEAAVTEEQLGLVERYIGGMVWYQYLGSQTLMSPGRSGFAAGPGGDAGRIAVLIDRLSSFAIEEERREALVELKAQLEAGKVQVYGNRFFWNNDDMIQRGPDYHIGVNMTCARNQSNEVIAGDTSAYTDFFADGATFIMRDGLEYAMSKGAWDCSAIPGTTVRETVLGPARLWGGYRGVHNLAGGVSDGEAGACGFVYQKAVAELNKDAGIYGVRANKGYFFVDGVMVALGAGITDLRPEAEGLIRTTVEQSEWRGAIEVVEDGAARVIARGEGEVEIELAATGNPTVRHSGIAYTILSDATGGAVRLSAGPRKTEWVKLHGANRVREDLPDTVDVLRLWIEHRDAVRGTGPESRYGYIVDASAGDGEEPQPVVLTNSPELQAVRSADGQTVQAMFYSAETKLADGGLAMGVSSPAAVMVQRDGEAVRITVSDLLQAPDLEAIEVRLELQLRGEGVTCDAKGSTVRIRLPGRPDCGKAATASLVLR